VILPLAYEQVIQSRIGRRRQQAVRQRFELFNIQANQKFGIVAHFFVPQAQVLTNSGFYLKTASRFNVDFARDGFWVFGFLII
jgi:hypothetical protein